MDVLFYPRKNDATNKAGQCSLYCTITVNSLKCVPFSTGIRIISKNWSPKKKTTNDQFSDTIRQELLRVENTLRRIKINLEEQNEPITAEIIKSHYLKLKKGQKQTKSKTEKITLETIYDRITENKMNLGASKSTKKHDYYLKKNFIDFTKKQGLIDIKPSEVTLLLVEEFVGNFKKSKNYLRQSLELLEKSLDYSMKKGIVSRNVIKDYIEKPKIIAKRNNEIGLELDELNKLKDTLPLNKKEEHAIDIFLFISGTSLDFGDYNSLTSENIDTIGNTKIIRIKRQKTDRYDTEKHFEHNAIIKDIALKIIEKYGSVEKLPRFKYSHELSKTLQEIADRIGIDKKMNSKRARKTFANLSINYENHSDEQTAYQMGHADTKQLKKYRRYNDNIIKNLIK